VRAGPWAVRLQFRECACRHREFPYPTRRLRLRSEATCVTRRWGRGRTTRMLRRKGAVPTTVSSRGSTSSARRHAMLSWPCVTRTRRRTAAGRVVRRASLLVLGLCFPPEHPLLTRQQLFVRHPPPQPLTCRAACDPSSLRRWLDGPRGLPSPSCMHAQVSPWSSSSMPACLPDAAQARGTP